MKSFYPYCFDTTSVRFCDVEGQGEIALEATTEISVARESVNPGRLLVTCRISVSALAIVHSPGSAYFRWPRSRRRQPTPPHSRSSNRLKQETARPSRLPQVDPSFPAGSGIRTSPSPPW